MQRFTGIICLILCCLSTAHGSLEFRPPSTFMLTAVPGVNGNIAPSQIPGGDWRYAVWIYAQNSLGGSLPNAAYIGRAETGVVSAAKPANITWANFVSRFPSPFATVSRTQRDEIRKYRYVCIYNAITPVAGDSTSFAFIGGCVTVAGLQIPGTCALSLPDRIDFGYVAAGQNRSASLTGSVNCEVNSSVTIRATNSTSTSSTVDLDVANGVSATMSVNGNDGLTGVTINAPQAVSTSFSIEALLNTLTTTAGGAYTGNAIVVASWP
ncbi:MrpH family fimbial adhesin [Serratia fonticola]